MPSTLILKNSLTALAIANYLKYEITAAEDSGRTYVEMPLDDLRSLSVMAHEIFTNVNHSLHVIPSCLD